jgi:NarL family two-component system response regulator LiaR
MKPIRIMIVDDHPMMREALRAAIEVEPDLQVTGEAANGQQAVFDALTLRPDVIVMDLYLPVKDGVEAISEIMSQWPSARILAITSSTDDAKVVAAVEAGAIGYLLKDVSREQFLFGVREVARGETVLPPDVATRLARGIRRKHLANASDGESVRPLTRREREVLALLGQGLSNQAIAQQLVLSESTVRVHVYNILHKLSLADRNQAIVYALRQWNEDS